MKWAFNMRLNMERDSAFLIVGGILFQTPGPCTLMDWLVTTSLLFDENRLSRKRVEYITLNILSPKRKKQEIT